MRPVVKIVLPLMILLGMAATPVAAADPITPTTPYPTPTANAAECPVERGQVETAEKNYGTAKDAYDREKRAFDAGVGSPAAVAVAETKLHVAGITLNEKKYAELLCRNTKGKDKDKDKACIELALQLNKLIDELPMRITTERIANTEYARIKTIEREYGSVNKDLLDTVTVAAREAKDRRTETEQGVASLREKIKKQDPACPDTERPAPKPPAAPAPPAPPAPAPPADEPISITPSDELTLVGPVDSAAIIIAPAELIVALIGQVVAPLT